MGEWGGVWVCGCRGVDVSVGVGVGYGYGYEVWEKEREKRAMRESDCNVRERR
jgi:hypothetical protein